MRGLSSNPHSLISQRYGYLVRDNLRQRCTERAAGMTFWRTFVPVL